MMLVGYARVSTQDQTLDLQKDALEKIGCTRIYTDTASGAKAERKGLEEALNYVREGGNYIAQQGPGIPLAQRRRNCNILVQLRLPQGFQFSIANVKYNGYADLPTEVNGEQESVYQFPLFSPSIATFRTRIKGPYTENYERLDTLGVASLVWSPCGVSAPMNIRTQVALTGESTLPAMMTLDQILGKVQQIYGLEWRKCTP